MPDNQDRLYLYRTLMQEIKERISYIDGVLNKDYKIPDLAGYDLCYTQLRLVCELMGIGCLLAHGNIPTAYTKRLLMEYSPVRIFSDLEKLHPDFYPRACSRQVKIGPPLEFSVLDDSAFLPRETLIELHGLTGNVLHARRVKDIGKPYHLDFQKIGEWKDKITGQLAVHMISLLDREHFIIFMMADPNTGGPSTIEGTRTIVSAGWKADEDRRFAPKDRKKRNGHQEV